jgi:hypothetical protein
MRGGAMEGDFKGSRSFGGFKLCILCEMERFGR